MMAKVKRYEMVIDANGQSMKESESGDWVKANDLEKPEEIIINFDNVIDGLLKSYSDELLEKMSIRHYERRS
jgi:hypothetical protein